MPTKDSPVPHEPARCVSLCNDQHYCDGRRHPCIGIDAPGMEDRAAATHVAFRVQGPGVNAKQTHFTAAHFKLQVSLHWMAVTATSETNMCAFDAKRAR